jgi:hypothetical protein
MGSIPPSQSPTPPERAALADLLHDHGERWQIEQHPDLPAWIAVHRSGDGRHIRCLVAHSLEELADKLETAETVEP